MSDKGKRNQELQQIREEMKKFRSAWLSMTEAIDQLDALDINDVICTDYPFEMSFDEQCYSVVDWCDRVDETIEYELIATPTLWQKIARAISQESEVIVADFSAPDHVNFNYYDGREIVFNVYHDGTAEDFVRQLQLYINEHLSPPESMKEVVKEAITLPLNENATFNQLMTSCRNMATELQCLANHCRVIVNKE